MAVHQAYGILARGALKKNVLSIHGKSPARRTRRKSIEGQRTDRLYWSRECVISGIHAELIYQEIGCR